MSEKKVVKVVKRAERGKRTVGVKAARDAKRKTARDMVANVTDWVSEFQQKQRVETAEAFDNLIRARQQPNEA
jgi:2-keto-3-deoxy-L-rhamnonate aldolase RhmA